MGCVLVAAGSGTRLGAGMAKALVPVGGVPMLAHAVAGVAAALDADGRPVVGTLVVVAPAADLDTVELVALGAWRGPSAPVVVTGGADRRASVRAGVRALPDGVEVVLVHDAARCLTPPRVLAEVAAAVRAGHEAVVPGVPVVDTVKQVGAAGPPWEVLATPARSGLRAVQTPQGFRRDVLERAHGLAGAAPGAVSGAPTDDRVTGDAVTGDAVTDDAGLVERAGGRVVVLPGHPDALKITTPEDLRAAEAVLAARAAREATAGPADPAPAHAGHHA